jgi:hypothetical protein
MECLYSFDKAIMTWQRAQANIKVEELSVSKMSLLRPNVGVEAAHVHIKRTSEGEIEELDKDELTALQSMTKKTDGASRTKPGEFLFCDEEAMNVPGLTQSEQKYIFGVRIPGNWSVWKSMAVSGIFL